MAKLLAGLSYKFTPSNSHYFFFLEIVNYNDIRAAASFGEEPFGI